jgi:hypothetical protein
MIGCDATHQSRPAGVHLVDTVVPEVLKQVSETLKRWRFIAFSRVLWYTPQNVEQVSGEREQPLTGKSIKAIPMPSGNGKVGVVVLPVWIARTNKKLVSEQR